MGIMACCPMSGHSSSYGGLELRQGSSSWVVGRTIEGNFQAFLISFFPMYLFFALLAILFGSPLESFSISMSSSQITLEAIKKRRGFSSAIHEVFKRSNRYHASLERIR